MVKWGKLGEWGLERQKDEVLTKRETSAGSIMLIAQARKVGLLEAIDHLDKTRGDKKAKHGIVL